MKILFTVFIITLNFCFSQGAWMLSNRTHPELEWETIKTKNFNIHTTMMIFTISL